MEILRIACIFKRVNSLFLNLSKELPPETYYKVHLILWEIRMLPSVFLSEFTVDLRSAIIGSLSCHRFYSRWRVWNLFWYLLFLSYRFWRIICQGSTVFSIINIHVGRQKSIDWNFTWNKPPNQPRTARCTLLLIFFVISSEVEVGDLYVVK